MGVDWLHLACPFNPFCFDHIKGLTVEISIIFDVLSDEQKDSSTDGSDILCQNVLSLPPGWTHEQQVSYKVGRLCIILIPSVPHTPTCPHSIWIKSDLMGHSTKINSKEYSYINDLYFRNFYGIGVPTYTRNLCCYDTETYCMYLNICTCESFSNFLWLCFSFLLMQTNNQNIIWTVYYGIQKRHQIIKPHYNSSFKVSLNQIYSKQVNQNLQLLASFQINSNAFFLSAITPIFGSALVKVWGHLNTKYLGKNSSSLGYTGDLVSNCYNS